MTALWYIVPWVLGSVLIGVVTGCYLCRSLIVGDEQTVVQRERQAAMKMMVELLTAAEQIATNVENHNTKIQEDAEQIDSLAATGEMEVVKQTLLLHMASLLTANRNMQDDLLCTRYRLEEQAVEIDIARHEARTDELTGVNNRKAFNEKLHLLLDAWRRQHEPFVLILADLDQFKWINDCHGHACGDRILKSVGDWLKQWVREGDFVGRYGGDEFAILLPHTDLDEGVRIATTVARQIADKACRVKVRQGEVSLSVSMGVASPRESDTDESIFERADESMYKCKRLGRDRVQCQEPEEQHLLA